MSVMYAKAHGDQAKQDLLLATEINQDNFAKFRETDEFKKWSRNKNIKELMFQAYAKHYCGNEYNGPLDHSLVAYDAFIKMYCPEKLGDFTYTPKYELPNWF